MSQKDIKDIEEQEYLEININSDNPVLLYLLYLSDP